MRLPIRRGIGTLEVLVGIVHVVLEIPVLAISLILLTEKLSVVLEVLLDHMIKPQVEASKLNR